MKSTILQALQALVPVLDDNLSTSATSRRKSPKDNSQSPASANFKYIVCLPVYEDRESAVKLMLEIREVAPEGVFFVCVEDGSVRDPIHLSEFFGAGIDGEVVTLKRNVGHQAAISLGLRHCVRNHSGIPIVVMDSDGEDDPAAIASMLALIEGADIDVAMAQRRRRSEPTSFKIGYFAYRHFFKLLTGRPIRFGNYATLSRFAATRLAEMDESWTHFAATVIYSRLRIGYVPLDRRKRFFGQSSMSHLNLVLHGMRSIVVFAEDVMVRLGLACFVSCVLCVVGIVAAIFMKLFGLATPGWLTTAAGILLLISIQTGILALLSVLIVGTSKLRGLDRIDLDRYVLRTDSTLDRASDL